MYHLCLTVRELDSQYFYKHVHVVDCSELLGVQLRYFSLCAGVTQGIGLCVENVILN